MPRTTDICATRSRRRRNSQAAHRAHEGEHQSRRAQVLAVIIAAGTAGATNHEIAARLRRLPHHISPRLSELNRDGEIFETGENRRRRGFDPAAVHVAEQFRRQWERERKQKDSSSAECPPE